MCKGNIKSKEQNINKLIFTIKVHRKTIHKDNSSMMIDYTVETFSILNEPGKEVYTGSEALAELINLDLSKEKVVKTEFNKCFDVVINRYFDTEEHKLYLKRRSASNINFKRDSLKVIEQKLCSRDDYVLGINLRINSDNSKILKANSKSDVISLINNQDICPEILILLYHLFTVLSYTFGLNLAQMQYLLGKSRLPEDKKMSRLSKELRRTKLDKKSNDEILKSHGSAVKLTK